MEKRLSFIVLLSMANRKKLSGSYLEKMVVAASKRCCVLQRTVGMCGCDVVLKIAASGMS